LEVKRTFGARRGHVDPERLTDTVEKVSAQKLWILNLKRSNPGKWIFESRLRAGA
jgi:hypothetical protein